MLTLFTPVYFGKENRFKAYEFEKEHFELEWQESYNQVYPIVSLQSTIFVQDNENFDCYALPEIVFQEWSSRIDDIAQVISIVRKRYPNAF